MVAKKEISWEFIRETNSKKYFLVKRLEDQYFIFRTPAASDEKSKNRTTLANWEGEIVGWGNVPAKLRVWLKRKKVKIDPKRPEILTIQA
ncbi:MAG TPA: hypothetical protein VF303_04910 [Candidatus Nanoarchaeia archaeon]